MSDIVGKAITLVEMDLDLYRATQFERARAGATPPGWTQRWSGTGNTFHGIAAPSRPSGKVARLTAGSGAAYRARSFARVPDMANVSTMSELTPDDAGSNCMVIARGSGAAGSEAGYGFERVSDSSIRLVKLSGGSLTQLAAESFTWPEDTSAWAIFDCITTSGGARVLVRAKVWIGESWKEPKLFTISHEDASSPITAAGWCGVAERQASRSTTVGSFRARSLLLEQIETLRFAEATSYLPKELEAIPSLKSVQITPLELSIGQNLGQRARVTASFKDHKHADDGEGYDRGTYWGKFRARKLFRRGQPLRIRYGLLGQALSEFETRHYVLESFDGPSADGMFSITAQDILKFADNERAQAPRMNNGFLVAPINNSTTTATLAPAGIGNLEYPSAGVLQIGGKEVCTFTRSGDTLTLVRGQRGTTAIAHNEQDRVQVCLDIVGKSPADIFSILFVDYADVPTSWIELENWQTEMDAYLGLVYTRLITEPTGVGKLVSELIYQAGLMLWPDDIAQTIRLRVIRPVPESAPLYWNATLSQKSFGVGDQPGTRLTQAWTFYGVRNPLEDLETESNYRSQIWLQNGEEESIYGQAMIRKAFAPWIAPFGRQAAMRMNEVAVDRFSDPPRKFSFQVQRYAGLPTPEIGAGAWVSYFGGQGEQGEIRQAPVVITRLRPAADHWLVEAEEMRVRQITEIDFVNRLIIIDTNALNLSLRTIHDSIFPVVTPADVIAGVNLTVVISAGVIVGSNSTASPALNVGSWPTGFPILLRNRGRIQGRGGTGWAAKQNASWVWQAATNGGPALYTRHPISFENYQCFGGGGGGFAGIRRVENDGSIKQYTGGGGGAGYLGGIAGFITADNANDPNSPIAFGQPGTPDAGGAGSPSAWPSSGGDPPPYSRGGHPGEPGGTSFDFQASPGASIDGVSHVTPISGNGDRRGPQIN